MGREGAGRLSGCLGRGFGLLEAIVALALLGGTGLALMSWVQQSWETATRVAEREAQARLQLDARRLVSAIDPVRRPEGEIEAGSLHLRWRGQVDQPMRPSVPTIASQRTRWLVGVYRLQVIAQDKSSGTKTEFEVLQAVMRPVEVRRAAAAETP